MIAIIRIRGRVGLNREIVETFNRLRLRKKYSCIVIEPNEVQLGMIKKIDNFIAYGEISKESLKKLEEKRKKKKGIFMLHPPRGGIKTKEHFPKGALGNHGEKINELIERML